MSIIQRRLSQVKDILTMNKTATTIPFDPDCTTFPKRKDVPRRKDALPEAAWVWGENDYLGRINLLTPTRVKSATTEIRTGEMIPLNLPLSVPETPSFGRETFKHEIKDLAQGKAHDDLYSLNTQSGTQWDGLRHVSHLATGTFYNGTTASDITGPNANKKCSIHYLAEHGIAGRGVLLDYKTYANKKGIQYSSFTDHRIPYEELYLCGQDQGLDIRPEAQGGDIKVGDLLFIRTGFVEAYYNLKSSEEWAKVALRPHEIGPNDDQKWAGVAQEEAIIDWLHDCYFAAVAGDAPAFETWPTNKEYYLHEYLLAMWGCPIGEMLDLEKLAKKCREYNKWTFFVTSSPANVHGGVSSHVNGIAIL